MKIGIIGMGYVGLTSAACLAELGHKVYGFERNVDKLKSLQAGGVSIIEPGITELLNKNASSVGFYSDSEIFNYDIDCYMVAVGTPTDVAGKTDMTALTSVFKDLSKSNKKETVIIRSTSPIGTARTFANDFDNLDIVFHPEFLREGTAIEDFFNPPKIVFGTSESKVPKLLTGIYDGISAKTFFVDYETAESVKYADNIFHALKVSFANEIGVSVAKKGADPRKVMEIFCSDTQLNLSSYYLKPGFAYGGSCLGKDLSSFLTQNSDLNLPLLSSIDNSNETHIQRYIDKIKACKPEVVIWNGLTFKENIDDLRRSPHVTVVKSLLESGIVVYAYDKNTDELFGESLEVMNLLKTYSEFSLNAPYPNSSCDVYVEAHNTSHVDVNRIKIYNSVKLTQSGIEI